MKILTVVGARPQFIKLAPLSKILRENGINEIIVHTGQHYDENMNDLFFKELEIPEPNYNLGIGSGNHGEQTGRMLIEIEKIILKEKPDLVIVYGDTNILFCPTQTAEENLKNKGITNGVYLVGDVMFDALLHFSKISDMKSNILERLNIKPKEYYLATIHRAENTDNYERLKNILTAFSKMDEIVVFPIHPRTRKTINYYGLDDLLENDNVKVIDPVGYLDMLKLEKNAKAILTDSGGVQKEAFWLKVPCITLRDETEWIETVNLGWNRLVGSDVEKILEAVRDLKLGTDMNFDNDFSAKKMYEIIKAV